MLNYFCLTNRMIESNRRKANKQGPIARHRSGLAIPRFQDLKPKYAFKLTVWPQSRYTGAGWCII